MSLIQTNRGIKREADCDCTHDDECVSGCMSAFPFASTVPSFGLNSVYSLILLFVLLFDLVVFRQSLQFASVLQFDETSLTHKGSVLVQELDPLMRVIREGRVLVLFPCPQECQRVRVGT